MQYIISISGLLKIKSLNITLLDNYISHYRKHPLFALISLQQNIALGSVQCNAGNKRNTENQIYQYHTTLKGNNE